MRRRWIAWPFALVLAFLAGGPPFVFGGESPSQPGATPQAWPIVLRALKDGLVGGWPETRTSPSRLSAFEFKALAVPIQALAKLPSLPAGADPGVEGAFADALPVGLREELGAIAEAAGLPVATVMRFNRVLGELGGASTTTGSRADVGAVAVGEATSMGQLLHGASISANGLAGLDEHVQVFVVDAGEGFPFLSVGFAGCVGVICGMNTRGVSIAAEVFPGPTSAPPGALPAGVLMRLVLQQAANIDEAERILRERRSSTGARFTLADGRRLEARVVERYGPHVNVRRAMDGMVFGLDPAATVECFVGECNPDVPRGSADAPGDPAVKRVLDDLDGKVRLGALREALEKHGPADALARVVFEPQTMRAHVATKRGSGRVPPEAWWTLELPACFAWVDAKKQCVAPWTVTQTGAVEVAAEGTAFGDVTLRSVAFDSPAPSGHAQNDRIHAAWYRPKEAKAAVITLPAWKDPNLAGQGMVALQLAKAGYAVLVLPLPWQADRAPPGVGSGSWTLSADLARTRAALLQGAADVVRASLWLEKEQGFPPARQGVMGLSLGGHAAALAFGAYPDRFGAGVFLLTGGRLDTAMLNENRILRRIRTALLARGVTPEEATDLIHDVDGVTWASPARKAQVLLIGADKDDVIPPANVRILADAYGGARTEWISGDHLSILLHWPAALGWVVEHLGATIGKP